MKTKYHQNLKDKPELILEAANKFPNMPLNY